MNTADLVSTVMSHVTDGRAQPDFARAETIQGNLTTMGDAQLRRLLKKIERGDSAILKHLIEELYGTGPRLVVSNAA